MNKLRGPERTILGADVPRFPTGFAKTKVYQVFRAFTMGIRRLQGIMFGDGSAGVAVLMTSMSYF